MTRTQAMLAVAVGILIMTAAMTWMFGGWGLFGGGVAFFLAPFATEIKEDGDG